MSLLINFVGQNLIILRLLLKLLSQFLDLTLHLHHLIRLLCYDRNLIIAISQAFAQLLKDHLPFILHLQCLLSNIYVYYSLHMLNLIA